MHFASVSFEKSLTCMLQSLVMFFFFQAKEELIEAIDKYIEERIFLAGKAISNFTHSKINDGDKILIYGL